MLAHVRCGSVPIRAGPTGSGSAAEEGGGSPAARPAAAPDASYIVFGRPPLGEEEVAAVAAVMRSGWVGSGPRVQEFEERFAEYVGTRYAVALSSGTAALHLALLALELRPGDEVITTPLTFVATANAILHARAVPVFADVDPETMNLDPEAVERRITPRTRALLPVHLAGRPCDMDALREIAGRHGLHVVEDAAHAIEALHRGRHAGALGDAGCFSFYVTKNMTTVEGGMLCTDRAELADRARVHALHGLSADAWARFGDSGYRHYEAVLPGFKYNMTDLEAVIGLVQLPKLEAWLERRRQLWARYDEAFADLPCRRPPGEAPGTRHARHLYTLRIREAEAGLSRDAFVAALHRRGVGTGVHYRSMATHRYFRERLGLRPEDAPVAYAIGEETVSLPLSPALTDEQVERVVEAVRAVLRGGTGPPCASSS